MNSTNTGNSYYLQLRDLLRQHGCPWPDNCNIQETVGAWLEGLKAKAQEPDQVAAERMAQQLAIIKRALANVRAVRNALVALGITVTDTDKLIEDLISTLAKAQETPTKGVR